MSENQETPQENQPINLNKDETPATPPVNDGTTTPPPFQPAPFAPFGGGQQNLPNATIALVLGILSIPACCCYGIFGLILGVIAWVLGGKDSKQYVLNPNQYSLSSYKNAKAGKVCGIIGVILSALYLIALIACLAIFGFAALKDPELMKQILQEKGLQ
ncbi:CCC motif membrane protein [Pedobacter sp. AW1-32]|uniref:CCC motif membrane protein n=1 Tax=Pedobacter sp. AW1-32 TaxID=3383026 RepID=UPI003FEDBE9A